MDKLRYLLALLMAGVEASVIFVLSDLEGGLSTVGVAGLVSVPVLLVGMLAVSRFSLGHARTMFPTVRPSLGFCSVLAGVGVVTLVGGAYCVLDALGSGPVHALLRIGSGVWLLFISSAISIAGFHLWRDVPRTP